MMRMVLFVAVLASVGCVDFGSYQAEQDAAVGDSGGSCVPVTCKSAGKNCDTVDDGCGHPLSCGSCVAPATCGGAGVVNVCGCTPDPTTCKGKCGMLVDRCGTTIDCGGCTAGLNCGGGGPNICGMGTCTPVTCQSQGKNCDNISDTCGKTINCGTCPLQQVCGGGGVVNVCGCTPTTCQAQGKSCGMISDGCGGNLPCGSCANGQSCTNNVCVCTPASCTGRCGGIDDGCGQIVDCGVCKDGFACMGDTCVAYSCTSKAAVCDPVCNTGCGMGLRCDTADAKLTGECLPTGNGNPGNLCTSVTGVSDSCGPQSSCYDKTCYRLCYSDADCPKKSCCEIALGLSDGSDSGFLGCYPSDACDPTVPNSCGQRGACYLASCPNSTDGSLCTTDIGKTQLGQPCVYGNDCLPGASCADDVNKCQTVCKLAAPVCPQNTKCTAVKLANGPFATIYGLCR